MTRPAPATTADSAPRTDEELLAAVRAQEPHAFQDLRDRHWPTAVAVAGLHTPTPQDAEQLAGTAVDQVVADLSGTDAPGAFLRARLVGVVGRAAARSPFAAETVAGVFQQLPTDQQSVLWHADVEGLEAAQVAALIGRTTAATTALHLEARSGMRAAYRRAVLELPATAQCEARAQDLGALVGGTLQGEQARRVQQHVDECPRCAADHLYLQDAEAGLRGWLLPVLAGVSPWGARAQEVADLVRAAGRVSAERIAAGPGTDVAGRSLAAVAVSRRGRRVLVGAGALAAAAALAGVALTGQAGTVPQAADVHGGDAAPSPGQGASTSATGSASASPTGREGGSAVGGDAEQVLSLPTTEPSAGPLTESAARARTEQLRDGTVLTAGGGPAEAGDTADRAADGGDGRTGSAVRSAAGAGSVGSSGTNGSAGVARAAGGSGAAGTRDVTTGGREAGGITGGAVSPGSGGATGGAVSPDSGGATGGTAPPASGGTTDPAPTDTGGATPGAPAAESSEPPVTGSPAPAAPGSPAPPAPGSVDDVPGTPVPEPEHLLPASPPLGVPSLPGPEELPPVGDLAPGL